MVRVMFLVYMHYAFLTCFHTGQLTYQEWVSSMESLGYRMQGFDQQRLWRMIDRDGSNQISEQEFVDYWAQYGN